MNPRDEIAAIGKDIDKQFVETDRIRQRLSDLQSHLDEGQEKISCPICNEPAPDGLEACSVCYGKHYVSACKLDKIRTLYDRVKDEATSYTPMDLCIDLGEILTTQGKDKK